MTRDQLHLLRQRAVLRRQELPAPVSSDHARARVTPDPAEVLPAIARLIIQVLAGRRPLSQIEHMLSPAVATRLAARVRSQYRSDEVPNDRVRIRHLSSCWVHANACEGVVMVDGAKRSTALAIRIERHQGRWRVTEAAGPEFAWRPIGPTRRRQPTTHRPTPRRRPPRGSTAAPQPDERTCQSTDISTHNLPSGSRMSTSTTNVTLPSRANRSRMSPTSSRSVASTVRSPRATAT